LSRSRLVSTANRGGRECFRPEDLRRVLQQEEEQFAIFDRG
jgi:hypothetical protein